VHENRIGARIDVAVAAAQGLVRTKAVDQGLSAGDEVEVRIVLGALGDL